MPGGGFISFEGIDGSGKSTQVRLLAATLRARGGEVVETREPGGAPGAEAIRSLLVEGDPGRWSAESEILLFTAARRDHLERTIRPALARGATVISDRFADSTRVYQGVARADLRATVDALHALTIAVEPDLTLILDLDPAMALGRSLARGGPEERFERLGTGFQERLRAGFLALAAEFPGRCRIVPATGSAGEVAARIAAEVAAMSDAEEPDRVPGAPHPRETAVLLGQAAAEARFLDAAASGRLHHAWLISGPRGVGKATLAWRIARYLVAGGEAASLQMAPEHPIFRRLATLASPQVFLCRRPWDDKGERLRTAISVDEVRALKSFLQLSAADAGWRVAIVDSADELTGSAANALLKLLEEPPLRTVLLLVSHRPAALLPTIRSRCRELRCGPLAAADLAAALAAAGGPGGRQFRGACGAGGRLGRRGVAHRCGRRPRAVRRDQ